MRAVLLVGVAGALLLGGWLIRRAAGPRAADPVLGTRLDATPAGGAFPSEKAEPAVGGHPVDGPRLTGSAPERVPLPLGGSRIAGTIRRGEDPVAGAVVVASSEHGGEVGRMTTGGDGRYAFEGLRTGGYVVLARLEAADRAYEAEGWVKTGEEEFDLGIVLASPTLRARVVAPDGAPVPEFSARFVGVEGQVVQGEGARGTVRLSLFSLVSVTGPRDLAGGFFEVWNARDEHGRDLGLAPARVGPLAADQRQADVRLVAGPTVAGRVLREDGPLPQVTVLLRTRRAPGDGPAAAGTASALAGDGRVSASKPHADGSFRIALLEPEGPHELGVRAPIEVLTPAPALVSAGEPPLTLRLRTAVAARVTVCTVEGTPVQSVEVQAEARGTDLPRVWPRRGEYALAELPERSREVTGADGSALLQGLDPGLDYRLTVGGVHPAWSDQTIEHWAPGDTTVRLSRLFRVSGRVVDPSGAAVPGEGPAVRRRRPGACPHRRRRAVRALGRSARPRDRPGERRVGGAVHHHP